MANEAPHIQAHVKNKAKLLARFKTQGPQVSKYGLPPGQARVKKWLVLDMRPPDFEFELDENWRLRVSLEASPRQCFLSLAQIKTLCLVIRSAFDFHCVTSWTALGIEMEGVKLACLLRHLSVGPEYRWMVLRGADGYSTYVGREDAEAEDVMLVWGFWDHRGPVNAAHTEDMLPLGLDHGGIRIFFPQLYGWKSAKWLTGLHFTIGEPREGFWETRGWHSRGRAQEQERYADPNNASAIMFYPLEYWLTMWARVYPQGVHAIQKTLGGSGAAFLNPHYWLFTAFAGPIFPWYLVYQTLMYALKGQSRIYRGSAPRSRVVLVGLGAAIFWEIIGLMMPALALLLVPLSLIFQLYVQLPELPVCS